MRTQQTSIFALLSIALVFTSCQKDSLVDMDILSQKDAGIDQQVFEPGLNKSILVPVGLKLSQTVEIHRPDCANSLLEEKAGDQTEKSKGCYGKYGLTDDNGRGWTEEFGSFTSHVDLEYDPAANAINGTVTFVFDRKSAILVVKAMGSVVRMAPTSEGNMLMVGLEGSKTSGPLDLSNFVGQLYIPHADLTSERSDLDHDASIVIEGSFGVESRDPVDYAIERIHNNRYH